MSTEPESKSPESEMGLDLDLHFLPSWAQKAPNVNQFEKYTGDEGERGRDRRGGDRRGGPGGRRDGGRGPQFGGPRRSDGPRPGGGPGGPRPQGGGDRGPRPGGDRRGPGGRPPFRGGDRGPRPERPEIVLPDIEVSFIPEDKGVESLARQIKLSGRAYPLFEIAYLVLKKPERYHVQLNTKKPAAEGQPGQMIYVCGLDDTIWLDEREAMNHVLDKHFATFYSVEKIPTDPPKGTYTFVAQCGMSGTILGPPNYHDYQNKLSRLHKERFSRMPFDMFKSRIKIVKDEAVVKKWLDEQSFRTEYVCLNIPETIKLNSREEVEKHFRETHLPNVIKAVDRYTLPGSAVHTLQNRGLHTLIRRSYDEQMRFPLKVVNHLSGQFARHGLQFFKVNKSITHVAVARPHFLDMQATPVSASVQKIVEFINTHPRSSRRHLIEALAPGAGTAETATAPSVPPPSAPVETPPEATAESATEAAPASPEAPAQPQQPAAPPEVQSIISDLHWLVHQGHVIEFANGILETAKKPAVRPPKPPKADKPESASAAPEAESEGEATTSQEDATSTEGAQAEASAASASEEGSTDQPADEPSATGEITDESGSSAGAQVSENGQEPEKTPGT